MKKLLFVFLSIIINFSILPAQSIEGNFELDSLVVNYTLVARDMVQTGNDGAEYTTTYDDSAGTYEVLIGWPVAGETSLFDFALPYWSIGDTMATYDVPLSSAAALQAFGLGLNTDFSDGAYTINQGSVYPTTNTVDCVTEQVFLPIQDAGTWTNGGFDPKVLPGNKVRWGWGIITSGVFATFEAPDMVNHVLGTDYGAGTPMESWGYIQANYTDDTYSAVDGLNIGWEAHDSESANLGIVSDGDPFFVQAEADLGLLNGMLGRSKVPVDSVTIGSIKGARDAIMAADPTRMLPEINVPAVNAFMVGGEGGTDGYGALDTNIFYVFDPIGNLLGGGDDSLFSGDEALMFTGYYATWNTLITMNGIADGIEEAAMDAYPNAPTMAAVVDSVIEWTTYYWEFDDASVATLKAAPVDANGTTFRDAAVAQVTAWATVGLSFEQIGGALLPFIQGAVTNVQAALTAAGTPLLYYDDTPIIVNDSGHDLAITDFDLAEAQEYGVLWNNRGGRVKAQSYANCFPAKWTQRVNSHWTYMGALSAVDDNSITVDRFELKGNYPNPFNPTTKIRFTNDRNSNVKVTVYALTGEKVATIMNKPVNSGAYDVSWNGRNTNGKIVPTGMYLYDIESDGRRLQGKMLFLK
jgi:hypothetical protein